MQTKSGQSPDLTAATRRLHGILLRLQAMHVLTHLCKALVVWTILACFIRGRMGWETVGMIAAASFMIFILIGLPKRRVALARLEKLMPVSDYRLTTLYERAPSAGDLPPVMLEKLLRQVETLLRSRVNYLSVSGFAFSFRTLAASIALGLLWSLILPAPDQVAVSLPPILRVKIPAEAPRAGSDVVVRVYAEGRMLRPRLQLSSSEAPTEMMEALPLMAVTGGLYEATLKRVTQPLTMFAVANLPAGGTVRSPDVRLSVRRAPILAVRSIWVAPPAYTRQESQERRSVGSGIQVLPGTELTLRLESDVPLSSASALVEPRGTVAHAVEWRDRAIEVKATVRSPGVLRVTASSRDGLVSDPPLSLRIDTEIDRAPSVSWLVPKQATVDAPVEGLVPMRWQADDDYGLSSFDVIVTSSSGEQKRLAVAFLPERRQVISYLLDVTPFLSYAGSEIEIVAEAQDNDRVNGPKAARSSGVRIKAPTVMDMYKRLSEQGGEVSRIMEKLSGESTRLLKKMASAARTMKQEGKMAWQMEQELVTMAEASQEAKREAEQALAELGKRAEAASKQNLLSRESLQKLAAIGSMMSNLLKEHYVQAQRELERALGSVRLEEKERAMMAAQFNLEQFVEQIDRTHRMLERVGELMAQSEANKAMQDLVEQTKKAFTEKNPDQLKSLSKSASSLMEKLQELAKDPAFSELKKALSAAGADLPKQFERAAKAMREAGGKETQESKEAQERLEKALQDMQSALQTGTQKSDTAEKQNAAEKLGSVVDGLVFTLGELQSSHEYFQEARSQRNAQAYSRHLQKSAAMEQILIGYIAAIASTAERLILFDPRPVQLLNRAVTSLHGVSEQDEDPTAISHRLKAAYRYSATAALQLLDVSEDMRKSGGSPKGNPMQDLSQLLQQMISAQGMLNQRVQMSMQLGQFGQNLEQMAFQQELIRRSMEAEAGRFSELAEKLGRIDQLLEEMRKTEDDLRRLGPSTAVQEKQQKILNKLMEMQHSLTDREEKEDKFEAEPFFGKPTDTSVLRIDRPRIDESEFLRGLPSSLRDVGRKYIRTILGATPP